MECGAKGPLNELIKAPNERKREEKLRKLEENKNIPGNERGRTWIVLDLFKL